MIQSALTHPDPSLLLEEHAGLLRHGETRLAADWANAQDMELRSLMALAGQVQEVLTPLALPATAKARLRRALLTQAQAMPLPGAHNSWRVEGVALARRSLNWLGRPESRWLLGGGAALAAGLGVAVALRRRQGLRASRQGA